MKSLLWVQWRETRIYLAVFVAWMLLAVCYGIGYEVGHKLRAAVGGFSGQAMLYSIFAAVFLAMRTAQGELSNGTIGFSASLPVSLRRIGAARIGTAAATLAIPILIAAAVLSFALIGGLIEQAAPRSIPCLKRLTERETAPLLTSLEQLWSVAIIAIFGGIELLLTLSLFGCWLRSQKQVGLLGAVMGLGTILAGGLLWMVERLPISQLIYGAILPQSLVIQWGHRDGVGSYTDHELAQCRWVSLVLAVPVLLIIGFLFTTQYGRLRNSAPVGTSRRGRWLPPAIWSYIPVRLSSRHAALIWLELRQSLPLVLWGFVFGCLITIFTVVTESQGLYSTSESLRSELPHSMAFVGLLWAAVVGSGLYSDELREDLGAFWRSRPISPTAWFWTKFIVGLVVVLSVLDGFTILAAWNAPRDTPTQGMSWSYILCFPLQHAWMYSLAVLGTCWLRKPVIGGFLAILGFGVVHMAITAFPATVELEPTNVYNSLLDAERAGKPDFMQRGYIFTYGTLAISIILIALLSLRLAKPLQPVNRWLSQSAS